MPVFKCWDALNASRETASDIEADEAYEAAERYADECYNGGDPFDRLDVHVEASDGTVEIFDVHAEYDVTFAAYKK